MGGQWPSVGDSIGYMRCRLHRSAHHSVSGLAGAPRPCFMCTLSWAVLQLLAPNPADLSCRHGCPKQAGLQLWQRASTACRGKDMKAMQQGLGDAASAGTGSACAGRQACA